MSSPSADFQDAVHETRDGSPAVESADGESAVAEEVEPGSGSDGKGLSELCQQQKARAKVKSREAERQRRRQQRLRQKCKIGYSVWFNETADDAEAGSFYGNHAKASLSDSRVGASLWIAKEKECFFSALARHGRDDLASIATAIGTKGQLEARGYCLALESGVQEQIETKGRCKYFSRVDIPAALEVSAECEAALDGAAYLLASEHLNEHIELQQKKYGNAWLIDADTALTIDKLLKGPDAIGNAASAKTSNGLAGQESSLPILLKPSTHLFDVTMLLQMSRSVFMNGPPEGYFNYQTVVDIDDAFQYPHGDAHWESDSEDSSEEDYVPEPAIEHSAVDDLYALATEITQKLVHATLFQATSRLRAKDADSPSPTVLVGDVHTAIDMMGFRQDRKTYWAKLPRRHGLQVYSESDKYKRGRTGTKNGVKLTYDEVETELGLPKPSAQPERKSDISPDRLDDNARSDADTSDDLEGNSDDSDISSDGIVEVKLEREQRKRRRGLSPDSYERAEERYMSILDRRADEEEDARLREFLGLEPREDSDDAEELPARPKMKKKFRRDTRANWRERTEVLAPWEVECVRKLAVEQDDSSSDEGMGDDDGSNGSGQESEGEGSNSGDAGERGEDSGSLSFDDEMALDD